MSTLGGVCKLDDFPAWDFLRWVSRAGQDQWGKCVAAGKGYFVVEFSRVISIPGPRSGNVAGKK